MVKKVVDSPFFPYYLCLFLHKAKKQAEDTLTWFIVLSLIFRISVFWNANIVI